MQTKEAIFAYHCDKLEADIQAKVYQDMGCQKTLEDLKSNVVLKSDQAKQVVENGTKTVFDFWYQWDKNIYSGDEIFSEMLEFVKEFNTQV